ncbi:unnamed protein product [Sphenostylis stenocarpa]|uniref:Uncharacterized protein n=1 Tax=Sphenostylis stenocarpa TaxID=92480 RepID=A0AA86VKB1_9FABA|nr:unnamed protein product [Sphenostylis stenocarpa]
MGESRKQRIATDNIIDAVRYVNGNINRTLMGDDLFRAIIRDGGGSSFTVITAWQVKLVPFPPKVTIFSVPRTLDQGASNLFQKFQTMAHKLPSELFQHSVMGVTTSSSNGGKTLVAELGFQPDNFTEMSWIQSVLCFSTNGPLDLLLQRNQRFRSVKAKSDYVTEPIPVPGLEGGLWDILLEENPINTPMTPYGGRMDEISGSETQAHGLDEKALCIHGSLFMLHLVQELHI